MEINTTGAVASVIDGPNKRVTLAFETRSKDVPARLTRTFSRDTSGFRNFLEAIEMRCFTAEAAAAFNVKKLQGRQVQLVIRRENSPDGRLINHVHRVLSLPTPAPPVAKIRNLKDLLGQRRTFTAKFERHGLKTNWHGFSEKTYCFSDIAVVNDRNEVAVKDHQWFADLKCLSKLSLSSGDRIQFDARVVTKKKGYRGFKAHVADDNPPRVVLHLGHPSKVKIVCPQTATQTRLQAAA